MAVTAHSLRLHCRARASSITPSTTPGAFDRSTRTATYTTALVDQRHPPCQAAQSQCRSARQATAVAARGSTCLACAASGNGRALEQGLPLHESRRHGVAVCFEEDPAARPAGASVGGLTCSGCPGRAWRSSAVRRRTSFTGARSLSCGSDRSGRDRLARAARLRSGSPSRGRGRNHARMRDQVAEALLSTAAAAKGNEAQ